MTTRRELMAGVVALFTVQLLPRIGSPQIAADAPTVLRDASLIARLRSEAKRAGLPIERMRIEDRGSILTPPVIDDDGRIVTPSYGARLFVFALAAPCCGETLESHMLIDDGLLALVIGAPADYIVMASEPHFEAIAGAYGCPCPHGVRADLPQLNSERVA